MNTFTQGALDMKGQNEQSREYGQIVTELLNIGNIEDFESFSDLLSSVQRAFSFSQDFFKNVTNNITLYCSLNFKKFRHGSDLKYENAIIDVKFAVDQILEGKDLQQIKLKELEDWNRLYPLPKDLTVNDFIGKIWEGDYPDTHFHICNLETTYNAWCRSMSFFAEGNIIIEKPPFNEGDFSHDLWDRLSQHFAQALAFCFIEFLRHPGNQALLRKCVRCERYFIASKNDVRIKKCPNCSPLSSMSKEERRAY